jgi:TonB family protein
VWEWGSRALYTNDVRPRNFGRYPTEEVVLRVGNTRVAWETSATRGIIGQHPFGAPRQRQIPAWGKRVRKIVLLAALGLLTGIAAAFGTAEPAADPVATARGRAKEGKFQDAFEILRRVIRSDTTNVPARLAEAEVCDAWIVADPRSPEAYGAAATILARDDRWSDTPALIARAPHDETVLHDVRLAVLRAGLGAVPVSAIRPLLEEVDADEVDPTTKKAIGAYRAILIPEGPLSLLTVVDYLDADPADRFGVAALQLCARPPACMKIDPGADEGLVYPKLREHTEPSYPDAARRGRIEGKVMLLIRILKDGTVNSVHVLSSTDPVFCHAAIDAVSRWRYDPATLYGVPVEMPYTIRTDFRLR